MIRKLLHSTAIAVIGVMALGTGASASGTPDGSPTPQDFAAMREQVQDKATVDRLAGTVFPHSPQVSPAVAAQNAHADAATLIPVYVPDAAFVAGDSPTLGRLAYVAAPATTGNGSVATVWMHRSGADWSVYNVASGDVEKRLAADAGNGYLLHEPQTGAWYSVDGDRVTVLEGATTGVAKGTAMAVQDYRTVLHDRYGDKLPGSDYARSGAAGGYGAEPAIPFPVQPVLIAAAIVIAIGGAFAVPRLRRMMRR